MSPLRNTIGNRVGRNEVRLFAELGSVVGGEGGVIEREGGGSWAWLQFSGCRAVLNASGKKAWHTY